jgi:Fic family protein
MAKYIYQYENWIDFNWHNTIVSAALGEVRLLQGKIPGKVHSLGFSSKEEKNLEMLTLDVLKSSEIEGENTYYFSKIKIETGHFFSKIRGEG